MSPLDTPIGQRLRESALRTIKLEAAGLNALRAALDALERRCGARLAAVEMPFADAAVDVDKPADLDAVRALTAR